VSDTLSSDETLQSGETAMREDLTPGAHVGRYIVHDLIGQGGMGLVYTAQDPQLDRQVAIKLLRANPNQNGIADSFGQMRLLREAQAMAQLSHPNVLPVYDVGEFGKSVFVAMELVRGVTLDKWVKAKPRTWREILQVFILAGRGLVAAHAAGLVHRDFKPANVLMGEDSRPRLTDFGIARTARSLDPSISAPPMTDPGTGGNRSLDTPLTQEGAMMGSPGYMAPEQYAGVATSPATDQFAFCVSLYEALYGSRPFKGTTLIELAHVTAMGAVPPPPKGTQVPAYLHRVIERGLQRISTNRHESMQALLDALENDPARKLRIRVGIGAGVAVAVGLGLLFWTQARSVRACRDADARLLGVWDEPVKRHAEKSFLATGKSYAALSWEHARSAMDQYAHAWTLARTEACEATQVRGDQTPAQMQLRYRCLEHRLDELKALGSAFAFADADVVDQASIAVVRLSPLEDCAQVKTLEERGRVPAGAEAEVEQIAQQLAQGRALIAAGKFDAAREKVGPAVEAARKLKIPAPRAEAALALAELEEHRQNYEASRAALEEAARYAEAAGDDANAARALSRMVSLVGWRLERPPEGISIGMLAQGVIDRIGGDPRIQAEFFEGLGDARWQSGDRVGSLEPYRKALEALIAVQGPQSVDVARLHASIGWVQSEMGLLAEAREEINKSKAIREKVLGADHPELASMWNVLGQLAATQDDQPEAARCYARSLAIFRLSSGDDGLSTLRELLNTAEALARDGQAEKATPFLQEAQAIVEKRADTPRTYVFQERRVHALIHAAQKHWAEAARIDRETLIQEETAYGSEHPESRTLAFDLGRALAGMNHYPEALEIFESYLALMDRKRLEHDPEYAAALTDSAQVLNAQGRHREAVERLERAVSLLPLDRASPRKAAAARFALAEALWAAHGDHERARRLASEAQDVYAKGSRPADADRVGAWLTAHK
jgi:tetratricopeptide (TPR) repeat protein/tRNA A-37 threonylcarbamoyl transferase component Bud32